MVIILAGKFILHFSAPASQCDAHISILPVFPYLKMTIPIGNRDLAVGNVTNQTQLIDTYALTNTTTFQGQTAFNGYTYSTTVTYVPGILKNTSDGVNHAGEITPPGRFAIDGLVSVFEAHIVGRPTPVTASS